MKDVKRLKFKMSPDWINEKPFRLKNNRKVNMYWMPLILPVAY